MSSAYEIISTLIFLSVSSSALVKCPEPLASIACSCELQAARRTCDRSPAWRNLSGMVVPRLLLANIPSSSPDGNGKGIGTPRIFSCALSERVPDPAKQQSNTTV